LFDIDLEFITGFKEGIEFLRQLCIELLVYRIVFRIYVESLDRFGDVS